MNRPTPEEVIVLRAALGLRPIDPLPMCLRSARSCTIAATPRTAPILEAMGAKKWVSRVVRAEDAPAAVRPLWVVTAEGISRLIDTITPPDAHHVKWRAVSLLDQDAAALLRHYGHDRRVADVLTAVTGLPARAGDRVEIKGTYTQALRAGEALIALAGIAEGMLAEQVKP